MAKYLDQTGLTQLWLKIRAYIDAKAGVPDGSVTTAKLADKAVTPPRSRTCRPCAARWASATRARRCQ